MLIVFKCSEQCWGFLSNQSEAEELYASDILDLTPGDGLRLQPETVGAGSMAPFSTQRG